MQQIPTNFYNIGVLFGKLSQEYQTVQLALPTAVANATPEQQADFWQGHITGWDMAENSPVSFVKVDRLLGA